MAVPATMKAFQLVAAHTTELRDVPVRDPGPGQVLIKVAGAGLCHSDLHMIHAAMEGFEPFTFGHETAGWIESLGAGVEHLELGAPVIVHGAWGCGQCRFCQVDAEHYCERAQELGLKSSGLVGDGGIAEYLLVPAARHLVPLGDVDPVTAGPLDDAALTPYRVIKRALPRLMPGSSAVVIGVGGLGHMAIQILKAMSAAQVIAVDVAHEKLRFARDVGADATILSNDDAVAAVREAAGGRGAGLVLDCVGESDTLGLAAQLVEPMSHLCAVGVGGGSLDYSFLSFPFECTVSNTYWGSKGELREVVALAERGKIQVHAERFPLAETGKAYELLAAGSVRGRAIAVPHG